MRAFLKFGFFCALLILCLTLCACGGMKKVSSIAVATQPETVLYGVGESFDPAGATLQLIYNNGKSGTVPITSAMVCAPTFTSPGTFLVEVTYGEGKSALKTQIPVTVIDRLPAERAAAIEAARALAAEVDVDDGGVQSLLAACIRSLGTAPDRAAIEAALDQFRSQLSDYAVMLQPDSLLALLKLETVAEMVAFESSCTGDFSVTLEQARQQYLTQVRAAATEEEVGTLLAQFYQRAASLFEEQKSATVLALRASYAAVASHYAPAVKGTLEAELKTVEDAILASASAAEMEELERSFLEGTLADAQTLVDVVYLSCTQVLEPYGEVKYQLSKPAIATVMDALCVALQGYDNVTLTDGDGNGRIELKDLYRVEGYADFTAVRALTAYDRTEGEVCDVLAQVQELLRRDAQLDDAASDAELLNERIDSITTVTLGASDTIMSLRNRVNNWQVVYAIGDEGANTPTDFLHIAALDEAEASYNALVQAATVAARTVKNQVMLLSVVYYSTTPIDSLASIQSAQSAYDSWVATYGAGYITEYFGQHDYAADLTAAAGKHAALVQAAEELDAAFLLIPDTIDASHDALLAQLTAQYNSFCEQNYDLVDMLLHLDRYNAALQALEAAHFAAYKEECVSTLCAVADERIAEMTDPAFAPDCIAEVDRLVEEHTVILRGVAFVLNKSVEFQRMQVDELLQQALSDVYAASVVYEQQLMAASAAETVLAELAGSAYYYEAFEALADIYVQLQAELREIDGRNMSIEEYQLALDAVLASTDARIQALVESYN